MEEITDRQVDCIDFDMQSYCEHPHPIRATEWEVARAMYHGEVDPLERIAIALGVKAGFYN